MTELLQRYDEWIKESSPVAAVALRQYLVSVEGKDGIIFPPTYVKPEKETELDWLGYNIDRLPDGTMVCLIDSVGSQANRIEPIFKQDKYKHLVPQIVIKAKDREINLLDAGHRAADAIVRFSDLGDDIKKAYLDFEQRGNATELAKLAPTSIVFGSWDSRGTRAKVPRVFRSVIRAFQVCPLHRSAQYIPPIDYVAAKLVDEPSAKEDEKLHSQYGLRHAPAPWTHGGVLVKGEIRRDACINLVAIRALGADGDPIPLRRYILGLALVCLTAPQDFFLREGCQLVLDKERSTECHLVRHDGTREDFKLTAENALDYANKAAEAFGVGNSRQCNFDEQWVKEELAKEKSKKEKSKRGKKSKAEDESEEGE